MPSPLTNVRWLSIVMDGGNIKMGRERQKNIRKKRGKKEIGAQHHLYFLKGMI